MVRVAMKKSLLSLRNERSSKKFQCHVGVAAKSSRTPRKVGSDEGHVTLI